MPDIDENPPQDPPEPPPAPAPLPAPPAGMKFLYGNFYEDGAGNLYVVWPDGTVIPTGLQEGMTKPGHYGSVWQLRNGKWVMIKPPEYPPHMLQSSNPVPGKDDSNPVPSDQPGPSTPSPI